MRHPLAAGRTDAESTRPGPETAGLTTAAAHAAATAAHATTAAPTTTASLSFTIWHHTPP